MSNTYAEEIKTPFYGEKLDGLMNARANCLSGIVNGNRPTTITIRDGQTYRAQLLPCELRKEKVKNKLAFQEELGP